LFYWTVVICMNPARCLENGTVGISDETYAVCRTDHRRPAAFATIRDETETSVIIDDDVDAIDASETGSGWKRLTFDLELPFELVGFLAAVATELADADISVVGRSSYSTDQVLVKESDLDGAVSQLEGLGCTVTGIAPTVEEAYDTPTPNSPPVPSAPVLAFRRTVCRRSESRVL
jgi:hypothetical protein